MSVYFTPIQYLSQPYLSQPQLDPRIKYLDALQQARAAEAEYLAAEAVQTEEAALRQRLYEIQLQKQSPYQVAPIRVRTQRQLAIEAARRLLAEEEAKTRQRRAEEEELNNIARRIEQQRHERLLIDRRIQEVRRQANRQTTAAKALSAINNHANEPAVCHCPPKIIPLGILPQPSNAPEAPKQEPKSLKEQLEARLYSDEAVEIRDTIQAILVSLADTNPTQPASSSSSSKGKEKAVPVTQKEPTSRDVAHSFDVVRTIEEAFNTLERDFVLPPKLDLDSGSSTTSKLAYTANNHPIKYYEQSLTNILLQLDQIDSFGNEQLRSMRKDVVGRVEKALEDLEREVEGRWKAKERKENRLKQEGQTPAAEPEQVLETPSLASEIRVPPISKAASESPLVEPISETLPDEDQLPSVPEAEQKEQESTAVVEQEQILSNIPLNLSQTESVTPTIEPSSDTVSPSYPPASITTPHDIEPSETVSTDDEAGSEVDTFLLSAVAADDDSSASRQKSAQSHDGDHDSDWSEVDA